MKCVAGVFLAVLVAVECFPSADLGEDLDKLLKAPNNSRDLRITADQSGIALDTEKKTHSGQSSETEQRSGGAYEQDDDNGDTKRHVEQQSEYDKSHKTKESHEETEDEGFKLGPDGLNIHRNKSKSDEKTVEDKEHASNRYMEKEDGPNSGHYEEAGSEYEKDEKAHDQRSQYDSQSFSLTRQGTAVDKAHGSSEKHDKEAETNSNSYNQQKDLSDQGGVHKVSKSDQKSKHRQASNESSGYSKGIEEHKEDKGYYLKPKAVESSTTTVQRNQNARIWNFGRKYKNSGENVATTYPNLKQEYLDKLNNLIMRGRYSGSKSTENEPSSRNNYWGFSNTKLNNYSIRVPPKSHQANIKFVAKRYENFPKEHRNSQSVNNTATSSQAGTNEVSQRKTDKIDIATIIEKEYKKDLENNKNIEPTIESNDEKAPLFGNVSSTIFKKSNDTSSRDISNNNTTEPTDNEKLYINSNNNAHANALSDNYADTHAKTDQTFESPLYDSRTQVISEVYNNIDRNTQKEQTEASDIASHDTDNGRTNEKIDAENIYYDTTKDVRVESVEAKHESEIQTPEKYTESTIIAGSNEKTTTVSDDQITTDVETANKELNSDYNNTESLNVANFEKTETKSDITVNISENSDKIINKDSTSLKFDTTTEVFNNDNDKTNYANISVTTESYYSYEDITDEIDKGTPVSQIETTTDTTQYIDNSYVTNFNNYSGKNDKFNTTADVDIIDTDTTDNSFTGNIINDTFTNKSNSTSVTAYDEIDEVDRTSWTQIDAFNPNTTTADINNDGIQSVTSLYDTQHDTTLYTVNSQYERTNSSVTNYDTIEDVSIQNTNDTNIKTVIDDRSSDRYTDSSNRADKTDNTTTLSNSYIESDSSLNMGQNMNTITQGDVSTRAKNSSTDTNSIPDDSSTINVNNDTLDNSEQNVTASDFLYSREINNSSTFNYSNIENRIADLSSRKEFEGPNSNIDTVESNTKDEASSDAFESKGIVDEIIKTEAINFKTNADSKRSNSDFEESGDTPSGAVITIAADSDKTLSDYGAFDQANVLSGDSLDTSDSSSPSNIIIETDTHNKLLPTINSSETTIVAETVDTETITTTGAINGIETSTTETNVKSDYSSTQSSSSGDTSISDSDDDTLDKIN